MSTDTTPLLALRGRYLAGIAQAIAAGRPGSQLTYVFHRGEDWYLQRPAAPLPVSDWCGTGLAGESAALLDALAANQSPATGAAS